MQKNNLSYDNIFFPSQGTLFGGLRNKNKDKKKYQFSIITVVLNDEKNIEETINSVISQKVDFEYIIIDGGSTDGTIEILKKYENSINLWISEKDDGIYDAMNKGIKFSYGNYIVMINSGDLFVSNSLNIIQTYIENKNPDFIFGTVKKKFLKFEYKPKKIIWSFDFYPSHSSSFFIKNTIQKKLGLYDNSFKLSADHEFFFRLLKEGYNGLVTKKNELIGIFRKVGGSYSSNFSAEEHLTEEINIRLKHSQSKFLLILILINNFLRKIFKKKKYRISLKFLVNKINYVFK